MMAAISRRMTEASLLTGAIELKGNVLFSDLTMRGQGNESLHIQKTEAWKKVSVFLTVEMPVKVQSINQLK